MSPVGSKFNSNDRAYNTGGYSMGRVAYTIAAASDAAGVTKQSIQDALRTGALRAKRVENKPIILTAALTAWINTFPDWTTDAG